jgi:hypothetical protein
MYIEARLSKFAVLSKSYSITLQVCSTVLLNMVQSFRFNGTQQPFSLAGLFDGVQLYTTLPNVSVSISVLGGNLTYPSEYWSNSLSHATATISDSQSLREAIAQVTYIPNNSLPDFLRIVSF